MTARDVLRELGINRYRTMLRYITEPLNHKVPYAVLETKKDGQLIFVDDFEAVIRRGDLIPRSRIEKRIEILRRLNKIDLTSDYTRNAIIDVLERLLKPEKEDKEK